MYYAFLIVYFLFFLFIFYFYFFHLPRWEGAKLMVSQAPNARNSSAAVWERQFKSLSNRRVHKIQLCTPRVLLAAHCRKNEKKRQRQGGEERQRWWWRRERRRKWLINSRADLGSGEISENVSITGIFHGEFMRELTSENVYQRHWVFVGNEWCGNGGWQGER